MKKLLKYITLLISSFLIFGCGNGGGSSDPSYESPTIELSETKIYLSVGQTFQLVSKTSETQMLVFWYVRDTNIASVSDNGLITALEVGKTICYAQCGQNVALCSVNVNPYAPESDLLITSNQDSFDLYVDDKFNLPITVVYGEDEITNYTLSCSIDNESVCSFIDNKVNCLSAGTAKLLLTATYLESSDQYLFTINVK